MGVAYLCFYGELNDFLPRHKRQVSINYTFTERGSIKDVIESLGVPHPEVYSIEVNSIFVDFTYIIQDGDNINVYPISSCARIKPNLCIQPQTNNIQSFVLDIHLGKLATSLRLLGFDTLYRNDYSDPELARVSSSENRILLTRDKGLLMRSIVSYGYYVRQTDPQKQIIEVMYRFNLFEYAAPFRRCLRCNGILNSVAKEVILTQIPESVKNLNHEFHRCQSCNQIYWKGSHYNKLQNVISNILNNV
ncbi:MAG: Mut7-C ubiquitin/RNAse domain-containing protein [Calothrix sp. C42_A2020_038]|nr:Mut7-C ubiquitin/RNAse domain-containing protein [Calothrix sp. C42_A2020_038]